MSKLKATTVKAWLPELDPGHLWLKCELNTEMVTSIYCAVCRQHEEKLRHVRNFSRVFIQGVSGSSMKKDNARKHAETAMHRKAIELHSKPKTILDIFRTTPIGRLMKVAKKEEIERVGKLMDVAYLIVKEELPFKKFQTIVELEKKHGVPMGSTYINNVKCQEFAVSIGETMEEEFINEISKVDFLSVLIDSATDCSNVEKEAIFVIYVSNSGCVNFRFFRLVNIKNGTAEGLKTLIIELFEAAGIDLKSKLVAFLSDGAAVNLGVRKGLAALLSCEMDWLVSFHCMSHRLELAVKDAFKMMSEFTDVTDMLMSLYYLYSNSPKKSRDLQLLAEVMEEDMLKITKSHGTRWIGHKHMACMALLKSYCVIVTHLEHMVEASSSGAAAEKQKIRSYVMKLKSFKFVAHLLFMEAVLRPLSALSSCLQADAIDLLSAVSKVETCFVLLQRLKDGAAFDGSDLSLLINGAQTGQVSFKGITLSDVLRGMAHFQSKSSSYVDSITECLKARFANLETQPVFQTLKLLDTRAWPLSAQELQKFGVDEMNLFCDHFEKLLAMKGFDRQGVLVEWCEFKLFWFKTLQHLNYSDLPKCLIGSYSSNFPNLIHVFKVLCTLPVSNAKLERCFSAMNRIKTDWRNNLSEKVLEHLVRISLEGPAVNDFNSEQSVMHFFSSKHRHPNVKPYGQRDDA